MIRGRWGVISLLCCLPLGVKSSTPRVVFSFGKVEVLRADATEWEFLRPGMGLRLEDLIRIPPQGLLRLAEEGGGNLALLVGAREATLETLRAQARAATPKSRRLSPASLEPAAVDVLPAGDPARGPSAGGALRFSDAEFLAWKRDIRRSSPLLEELARSVVDRYARVVADARYPTLRLQQTRGLFEAMRVAVEEGSPVIALFPEGEARPATLFAALLTAAGIPFEPLLDEERRPILLIELLEPTTAARRLSVNAGLVRRSQHGRLAIPLAVTPATRTLLDAWYAAENALRSRMLRE